MQLFCFSSLGWGRLVDHINTSLSSDSDLFFFFFDSLPFSGNSGSMEDSDLAEAGPGEEDANEEKGARTLVSSHISP